MRKTLRSVTRDFLHPLLLAVTRNDTMRGLLLRLVRGGVLPAAVWERLPVDLTFPVDVSEGHKFVYRCFPEDSIGRALYWHPFRTWEHQTVRAYCRFAQDARVILDIGANTGVYSLIACAVNPKAKVIAFEPVPDIFDCLAGNIQLNAYQNRCLAFQVAVSDFTGRTDLFVPKGNNCTATLRREGWGGARGTPLEVAVTTIDHACAEEEEIDLVKIDVEGCEDKVLGGMKTILRRSAPIIIFECHPAGPYRAVERILSDAGYRFFNVHMERPTPIHRLSPDKVLAGHWNVLSVPEAKLNTLW
jgi:FkbM family methyltransferase